MSFDSEQGAVIGLLVIGASTAIIAIVVLTYIACVCYDSDMCACCHPSRDCCVRQHRATAPVVSGTFVQNNPIRSPA